MIYTHIEREVALGLTLGEGGEGGKGIIGSLIKGMGFAQWKMREGSKMEDRIKK